LIEDKIKNFVEDPSFRHKEVNKKNQNKKKYKKILKYKLNLYLIKNFSINIFIFIVLK
jgi:hypothetical protein